MNLKTTINLLVSCKLSKKKKVRIVWNASLCKNCVGVTSETMDYIKWKLKNYLADILGIDPSSFAPTKGQRPKLNNNSTIILHTV